jgi:16S rRNA processing protein RimM
MSEEKFKLIKMGSCTRPHGIRGEAELFLLNQENSILENGMNIILYPASEKSKLSKAGEEWQISQIRFGNKVICLFQGIKDRTHLEQFLPFDLYLSRDEFPETDDDEIYLVDLIDWEVISLSGEVIGALESFSDNGMQYIFEVRLKNGEKISLPYVDAFFPKIDQEKKKITMIMPEYTE